MENTSMPAMPPLMEIGEVAAATGVSRAAIRQWVARRSVGFPAPIRIGHRLRWRREAVAAWIERTLATEHAGQDAA